jgi:hypothetical protein
VASTREKQIIFIMEELNRRARDNKSARTKDLNKNWANSMKSAGYVELRSEMAFKHKPNRDHELFTQQYPGS